MLPFALRCVTNVRSAAALAGRLAGWLLMMVVVLVVMVGVGVAVVAVVMVLAIRW